MTMQQTIEKEVSLKGPGLFSGQPCRLTFQPAPEDTGVVFVRTDTINPIEIPADIAHIAERDIRTTSLAEGNVTVETIEHVMAAVKALGIDNIRIEATSDEMPNFDGSALPFIEKLQEAGIEEQDLEREDVIIDEPIIVQDGEASLAILPGPTNYLEILYELDYQATSIGRQVLVFRLGEDDFLQEIAPARTFVLEEEARRFQEMGLGKHLTAKDVVVMGAEGPIDNELRFDDEHVRHKMLDLIGDLGLLGRRIYGRIVATRSGHDLNQALVKKLTEYISRKQGVSGEPVMDIRKIMRLLPHRYPFLMIDRIVQLDGEKKAVGVKNVTINEPFFQGHYPSLPIMPGVMIVEAMAQLSGILLGRRLEHTGKVAVLLSMDKVKMRRPVRPGDQLVLVAEALHARSRTGHCRVRATVDNEIAAEAEIKFMLVDSEPV